MELLELYREKRHNNFNWRWLLTPGVALTSLLLLILISGRSSTLNNQFLEIPSSDIVIENTRNSLPQNPQSNIKTEQTQLTENSQNLDQLDQELTELSNTLNNDADLEAAISFRNL